MAGRALSEIKDNNDWKKAKCKSLFDVWLLSSCFTVNVCSLCLSNQ